MDKNKNNEKCKMCPFRYIDVDCSLSRDCRTNPQTLDRIRRLNPFAMIGKTLKEKRVYICSLCDHYDKERNVCNLVGCDVDKKASVTDEECPIGKW